MRRQIKGLNLQWWLVIAGSGLLLPLMVLHVEVLIIHLPSANPSQLVARLPADRLVVLRYLHSVEGTPVEGHFRITPDGQFEILQTRYTSVGTGLPTAVENRPEQRGEWFVVNESQPVMDRLGFFAIPENALSVQAGAVTFDIRSILQQGRVDLKIRQISLGRWWHIALKQRLYTAQGHNL